MPLPLLLAAPALVAAGAAAVKAAPALLPSKARRENRKRLKELDEHLGFTPEEVAELEAEQLDEIEAVQAAQQRDTAAALSNSVNGGSGDALRVAGLQAEQGITARRRAKSEIDQLERDAIDADEQEREDRLAFGEAARRDKYAAVAEIGSAALQGYETARNESLELGLTGGAAGQMVERAAIVKDLTDDERVRLRALMIERGYDPAELDALTGGV